MANCTLYAKACGFKLSTKTGSRKKITRFTQKRADLNIIVSIFSGEKPARFTQKRADLNKGESLFTLNFEQPRFTQKRADLNAEFDFHVFEAVGTLYAKACGFKLLAMPDSRALLARFTQKRTRPVTAAGRGPSGAGSSRARRASSG